jgi:ParB/RepB/Spo0J family partition protein
VRDFDFRVIELALIDAPAIAMRAEMDDGKLGELAADIKRNGVLQPLGVFPVDGRHRIIYGHRRYVAAQLAGERVVPCRVHADGDAHEEDYKLSENRFREDVNPADEATWFADLLERRCGGDIEQLCALVNAGESYINGRLDLLRGDDQVRAELRAGRINLAVARELNKFREGDWRRFYLTEAITQGATAAVVARWRMERERIASLAAAEASGAQDTTPATNATPLGSVDACAFCLLPDDPLEMEYVRVHRSCLKAHTRQMRAAMVQQS